MFRADISHLYYIHYIMYRRVLVSQIQVVFNGIIVMCLEIR